MTCGFAASAWKGFPTNLTATGTVAMGGSGMSRTSLACIFVPVKAAPCSGTNTTTALRPDLSTVERKDSSCAIIASSLPL